MKTLHETMIDESRKPGAPTRPITIIPSAYNTPADWLDALIKAKGLSSDYQLAKLYKMSRGRISNYRTGKNGFDVPMCMLLERELHLATGTVATWTRAYKAADFVSKEYWSGIRELLARAALNSTAAMLLFCLIFPSPADAQTLSNLHLSSTLNNVISDVFILCKVALRRILRRLQQSTDRATRYVKSQFQRHRVTKTMTLKWSFL